MGPGSLSLFRKKKKKALSGSIIFVKKKKNFRKRKKKKKFKLRDKSHPSLFRTNPQRKHCKTMENSLETAYPSQRGKVPKRKANIFKGGLIDGSLCPPVRPPTGKGGSSEETPLPSENTGSGKKRL